MEIPAIIGLLIVIIIGLVLISTSSQSDTILSGPLFYGGIIAVIVGGFAMYRVITA